MGGAWRRKMHACIGSILRGTRLQEPRSGAWFGEGFVARHVLPLEFDKRWIRWWNAERKRASVASLAAQIVDRNLLNGVRISACEDIIREALRKFCTDARFFSVGQVTLASRENLHECLCVQFSEFAERFLETVEGECGKDVDQRLTIIPVMPRLRGISFMIPRAGIGLQNRLESEEIEKFCAEKFYEVSWDASLGEFNNAEGILQGENFTYLAFTSDRGTTDWCQEASRMRIRAFLAVVLGYFQANSRGALLNVIATPTRAWIQFPQKGRSRAWTASDGDPVAPYLAYDLTIDRHCIEEIETWYDRWVKLSPELIRRAERCAHFTSLALCATGIFKFIFFYVALDALYGNRGSVERSIERGISRDYLVCADRASHLFSLRNDLLHGGCRTIEEWSGYEEYLARFRSTPSDDAGDIVLNCLFRFPSARGNS